MRKPHYARTLTAPRIRQVIETEGHHVGFTFLKTGRGLDREAILGLEREKISAVICQTDRTGAGSGIRRIDGRQWIISTNSRGEALALVWQGKTGSRVTSSIINHALAEAKKLGLKTPLRIYGTTCAVSETRSFRFCQIPDEILASLASDALEEEFDVSTDEALAELWRFVSFPSKKRLPRNLPRLRTNESRPM